ncbi:CGCGG family rSAM-modified RiPP protein [Halogeometricum sp. S1BR25-6]|uniref:CGCGG family rSAM-modified RiPP protein n=1 Tax=Halogeometricum salsisoli TaxID=2950536 RepID=A0ABU2GHJ1_9EURY|nr:CGCGG family rSAM-modified RiPP protein [Halogeometricum sp. S1BR25-6]MDS0300256.1 CGCGG family rSAM-modified RiPP protein [Halogeometricum sp. S1BR25-6]
MGDHTLDGVEPVTDRIHHNSWSANLEKPIHGDRRDAVVAGALEAVEHTAPGYHVNLVTHGAHGRPEEYLGPALREAFGGGVEWSYVEQCGCGGHVLRVRVFEREPVTHD